jgi:large subunit ribosomal protein L25
MSTATSNRLNLAAEPRELTGKKVAILRRAGRLPAVVFGHGLGSENVSVDAHEFDLLRRKAGQNALIDLSVDGKKARPVLVHGVQVHPVNRRPLHVDLFLVRMTEELTVDVPLVAIGTSHAVENLNGTLMHQLDSVRIKALPDHLPQSIEYSIESLVDFDATIKVSDLAIPGDVTLLTDPDEVVAKVLASRLQAEEAALEAEEAVEGEAAAEGAEGAPAEGGEAGEAGEAPSGDSSES